MKRTIGFLLAVCLLLASACGGPMSSESPAPVSSPTQSAPPVSTENTEPQEAPVPEVQGAGKIAYSNGVTPLTPEQEALLQAYMDIAYESLARLEEFIMNRAYALNRDKLKCGVCGGWLISSTPWAHRISPNLPLDRVNRVNNLVSLHKECFMTVNNHTQDISQFDVKAQKKIIGYWENPL